MTDFKYLDVCSGISAPTVAWKPLGWQCVAYSEIEKFPAAVLQYHYPDIPNLGDMNEFRNWPAADIDLLVGGTPCQSFSVAGLREGLKDPRGNLALTYLAIAERYRPTWLVWENVPGVLSSHRGRDFGSILGAMAKLGYGFAYRVLDAQYHGVAQRRRRVFVVGYLGDWRRAAEVLFEPESLCRNPPPSREAGQKITYDVAPCLAASGRGTERTGESRGQDCLIPSVANPLTARMHKGINTTLDEGQTPIVTHPLPARYDSSEDGCGRGTPLTVDVAAPLSAGNNANSNAAGRRREDDHNIVAFNNRQDPDVSDDVMLTLGAKDNGMAVAFKPGSSADARSIGAQEEVACTLEGGGGGNNKQAVQYGMAVRRLTPLECERLQGFPDDYTRIAWRNKAPEDCPDGPRYKALGNSMAVPVLAWIGRRIQEVDRR